MYDEATALMLRRRATGQPTTMEDLERDLKAARDEIAALQAALRVNALRWGYDHADVDAVIAHTKKPVRMTDALLWNPHAMEPNGKPRVVTGY